MSTYVFGDIQGCYDELAALLEQIDPDPIADELWFAGDLINRGPNNVDTLTCLLYTSPSPRDLSTSRMPSSA